MLQPLPQPKMIISGGIVEVSVEETLRKVKINLRKRFEIPLGFTSESKVPPASNHLPFLSLSQLFEDFFFFFNKNKIKRLLLDLINRKWWITTLRKRGIPNVRLISKRSVNAQTQHPFLFCTTPSHVRPLGPSLFPKEMRKPLHTPNVKPRIPFFFNCSEN